MTRSTVSACVAASLLAFATAPAPASERFVQPIGLQAAADRLEAACTAAASPACSEELGSATREATRRLVELARYRPEIAATLAARAADSGSPEMRAAAADVFAQPFATASATPILSELLDDPVPSVRFAALRALRGSNDEAAQRLANRAGAFEARANSSLAPDSVPATPGFGAPLPPDAVYLYFASDAAAGRLAYSTAEAPSKLLATLAKKGRGPFTPAQFRQEIEGASEELEEEMEVEEGEMPSPEQMAKMMEMAGKMMQEMNKNPNATPEQQGLAAARALGVTVLDADLADPYGDADLFGDPKLFIVPLADGSDAAVAVFLDRAVGRTGIDVHRAPRLGG